VFNEVSYKTVVDKCLSIAKEKYRGYGPDNIGEFADLGCLIRANDKFRRLRTVYMRRFSGCSEEEALAGAVSDEKIDDTIMDCINYLVYMMVLRRNEWT
jgi:hypothetical protein